VHLDQLEWSEQQLKHGMIVKLKELPFKVRLFKVALPEGGIEWVITNSDRPDETTTHLVQQENEVRWQVEQLHRELKQLTAYRHRRVSMPSCSFSAHPHCLLLPRLAVSQGDCQAAGQNLVPGESRFVH
jgi:hypothetical protein